MREKMIQTNKNKIKEYLTKQLNLKISSSLMEDIEIYSNEFGYNNAQELIREAIRDKIHGSNNVRGDYIEKLIKDKDYMTSIGKKQSLIELDQLKKRAQNE